MIGNSIYDPSFLTLFLIGILGYATLFPLFRNIRRQRDLLEPVVILGGLFFLYYVVSAVGISVLNLEPGFPAMRRNSHALRPAFNLALGVILLGVLAFYAGYWTPSFQIATIPTIKPRTISLTPVLVLWAVSIVFYLALLTGVFSANMFVYLVSRWHFYAILAMAVLYYLDTAQVQTLWPLATLITIELAIAGFVRFEMDQLLVLVILLMLAYHYAGPGVRVSHGLGLGVLVGLLFPLSEIMEELQAGVPFPEALYLPNHAGGVFTLIHPVTRRMIGIDALTMIIARTPDVVSYQYGVTVLNTVYAMVPHAIWPGKPTVVLCQKNNLYFSGRGADSPTCAAMTLAGELYWNFSWIGVIVGLALLGVTIRAVYEWFQRQRTTTSAMFAPLLVYAVVLVNVMRIENGTARIGSRIVKELAFAGLFLFFATRPVDKTWGSIKGTALERSVMFRLSQRLKEQIALHLEIFAIATQNSKTVALFQSIRDADSGDGSDTESAIGRAWRHSQMRQICMLIDGHIENISQHPAVENSRAVAITKKLLP